MTTRRQVLGQVLALGATALGTGVARAAGELRPWPAGRAVPPLRLPDLNGGNWSLESQRGHALLVNFWASWCEPCRAEMPTLELLATREEARGLVVTVNYRESRKTIQRYLETLPMSLPILLDADGEAASVWTPRLFPTSVLIDRDGRPRMSVLGEFDWLGADARRLIDTLYKEPSTGTPS